jgi:hypothetical protein
MHADNIQTDNGNILHQFLFYILQMTWEMEKTNR